MTDPMIDLDLHAGLGTGEPRGSNPQDVARWTAEADRYLRSRAVYALGVALLGVLATLAAVWSIDSDAGNSTGLTFAGELVGLVGGPTVVVCGLIWWVVLRRRRWSVQHREWALFPASSAALRFGPVSLTVVGVDTDSGRDVIFPEQLLRARVRRLVDRDQQLLVLLPRKGKLTDASLFAGAAGSPVFTESPAMSEGAQGLWERRGARALDRAASARLDDMASRQR